MVEKGG